MSLWESIKDALFELTSVVVDSSTSGFIPLSRIGMTLVTKGALKDYGSGEATKRQLRMILAEIRRYNDSCEIRMDGKEILVKVNFRE